MTAKLYQVTKVKLTIQKSEPPRLVITADGKANTSGWKNQQLIPYVYIVPPADGFYEFDLVATPPRPGVIVSQTVTDMNPDAEFVWEDFPAGLVGVRVYASSNSMSAALANMVSQLASRTVALKGKLTDEGVECQGFRSTDNVLYTLVGNLQGFKSGDEVSLIGNVVDFSFCMQGTTIAVTWIAKA